MKWKDVVELGRVATIHNPKHFYPNSYYTENSDGRVYVMGRVKSHIGKGFKKVGILK
jgi:hypothetical protein